MSWIARPKMAFQIGDLQVVTCDVIRGEGFVALPKRVNFCTSDGAMRTLTILGTSTASRHEVGEFDYRYEGPVISPGEINGDALITDLSYEEATKQLVHDEGSETVMAVKDKHKSIIGKT